MNAAHQTALELAALGYKVFPLSPGKKAPHGGLAPNGVLDATCEVGIIEAWIKACPSCNWGLSTEGLLVVDSDGKDNPWPHDQDRMMDLINAGAICMTARGGRHYIFRQPAGKNWRSTAGKLGEKVDTRANGGYVVLNGSTVTNDGVAGFYQWVTDMELVQPMDELPEPPEWLTEALDAAASRKASRDWVDNGNGDIPEGRRNHTLASMAGGMRRFGMSEAEILAAITVANEARCVPPLDSGEVEKIAENISRYEPDQLSTDIVHDIESVNIDSLINPHRILDGILPEKVGEVEDPGEFPKHLLEVEGFIRDFMNLVGDTCHKHQPVLALAAGISIQSLLAGRRVMDPIGTRPNIYCIGVAPSGQGKEAARKLIKEILQEANLHTCMGEGVASHAGLITAVEQSPRLLLLVDEVGRWLKTMGNPAAAPHHYAIITNLMKLFTSADSVYIGDHYADADKMKTITQPSCSLYGTTVPKSLYESLTSESVTDGFLSRVFIFEGEKTAERRMPKVMLSKENTAELVSIAKKWDCLKEGNMPEGMYKPNPIRATFEEDAAKAIEALASDVDTQQKALPEDLGTLWTRCEEKARRLALIHACSRIGPEKEIQISNKDMDWGIQLAKYLTKRAIWLCQQWISEGQFDAKRRAILRFITEETIKNGYTTATSITRRFQHFKSSERKECMDNLEQGGLIVQPKGTEELKKLTGKDICNTKGPKPKIWIAVSIDSYAGKLPKPFELCE